MFRSVFWRYANAEWFPLKYENKLLKQNFSIPVDTKRNVWKLELLHLEIHRKKRLEREKKETRYLNIVNDRTPEPTKLLRCQNFIVLSQRVKCLKLNDGWAFNIEEHTLKVKKVESLFLIPEYDIIIDSSLGLSVAIYECLLPEDHHIDKLNKKSVRNITVSRFLKVTESYNIYRGLKLNQHTKRWSIMLYQNNSIHC